MLFGDKSRGLERLITETSDELERQVGIRLRIIGYRQMEEGLALIPRNVLQRMHEASGSDGAFDIGITECWLTGLDLAVPVLHGWLGIIDDTYRRYIVIRVRSKFVLLHEIYHAFLFSHDHGGCVMFTGLLPIGMGCIWPERNDWKEILENKWRDFSVPPKIPSEDRMDLVREIR